MRSYEQRQAEKTSVNGYDVDYEMLVFGCVQVLFSMPGVLKFLMILGTPVRYDDILMLLPKKQNGVGNLIHEALECLPSSEVDLLTMHAVTTLLFHQISFYSFDKLLVKPTLRL